MVIKTRRDLIDLESARNKSDGKVQKVDLKDKKKKDLQIKYKT